MWLDWCKSLAAPSVHLHWGPGVLLLQWGQRTVQVLPCQPTWAREQVLAEAAKALQAQRTVRTARTRPPQIRLHITLGASLCPLSCQALPQGLQNWDEVQAFAQAHLAHQWPGQALCCAVDPAHPQLAVGVAQELVDALQHWAQSQEAVVVSIRPLWSVATACRRARHPRIQALVVQERDALTLVYQAGNQIEVGLQPLPTTAQDGDAVRATLRRWRIAHGVEESAMLHLTFGNQRQQPVPDGPACWSGYWSLP